MRKTNLYIILFTALQLLCGATSYSQYVNLQLLGTYQSGVYDDGATEIAAYDVTTQRLFSVNASTGSIDVLDINQPESPVLLFSIDLSPYGAGANSVACYNGILAAAVENVDKQANGSVVFFDANGNHLADYTAGALPDMITFTPDGKKVVVANEGEPNDDYTIDPLGSITVLNISSGVASAIVTQIDFTEYNTLGVDPAIKINGPGSSIAQDLEPEYIAISHNSKLAYVTLQENNALAIINLNSNTVNAILPLGFKDHSLIENALDASDKNGGVVDIKPWPVYGMYQPDAIGYLKSEYGAFLVTANEGDVRDYGGFAEAARVKDIVLDSAAFPDATDLQLENNLGRLNVTTSFGDTDNDGDFDELYAFGARSFSVWSAVTGELVYDSGDDIEQITYAAYPDNFNASNSSNTKKGRSDDKGPEPEGLVLGNILGKSYLFLGLERIGGVMVYDMHNPTEPEFIQYYNNRDFAFPTSDAESGDLGPEGLLFIPGNKSPNGRNLLVVSSEVSGTVSIYATDYQCGKDKVLVCYDGVTYCLALPVAEVLLGLGAELGECAGSERYGNVVEQEFPLSGISVYPNPANTYFNLVSEALLPGYWTFELTDITGRNIEVKHVEISEYQPIQNITFSTSGLPNGTYMLNASSDAGLKYYQKVIINK